MTYSTKKLDTYVKQYKKKNYKYFNEFIKAEKELYYFLKRNNLVYDFKYKLLGEHFNSDQTIYSFNDGFKLILGLIPSDKVNTLDKELVLRNEPNKDEFEYKELLINQEYFFSDIMFRFFMDYYDDKYEIELCTSYESGDKKNSRIIYDMYNGNLEKIKIEKYKYYSGIINYEWEYEFKK